jgi:hypothetical protein
MPRKKERRSGREGKKKGMGREEEERRKGSGKGKRERISKGAECGLGQWTRVDSRKGHGFPHLPASSSP